MPRPARLPRRFLERLQRAVAHYGLESLERTPELLDVLFWVFKAQRRLDAAAEVVLGHPGAADRGPRAASRPGLRRPPGPADRGERRTPPLALRRGPRGAVPALRPAALRGAPEAGVRGGGGPAREAPRPAGRRGAGGADRGPRGLSAAAAAPHLRPAAKARRRRMRELLLEILVRRYYRIRDLEELRVWRDSARALARAAYTLKGRRAHLLSTHARADELEAALASLLHHVTTRAGGRGRRPRPLPLARGTARAHRTRTRRRCARPSTPCFQGRALHRVSITPRGPRQRAVAVGAAVLHLPLRAAGLPRRPALPGLPHHDRQAPAAAGAWPSSSWSGCPRWRTSTSSAAWPARTRRTSGSSGWPRCATSTPVRDAAGPPGRGAPSRAHVHGGAGRDPALPEPPQVRRSACTGTASCSTSGRRSLFSRDEIMAMTRKLVPATEGLGIESVFLRAELPDAAHGRAAALAARDLEPRTVGALDPRGAARERADPAALRVRAEGDAPAPARPHLPLRDRAPDDARRGRALRLPARAPSRSWTSTPRARLVGVERAYGKNTANVVVGVDPQRDAALPGRA